MKKSQKTLTDPPGSVLSVSLFIWYVGRWKCNWTADCKKLNPNLELGAAAVFLKPCFSNVCCSYLIFHENASFSNQAGLCVNWSSSCEVIKTYNLSFSFICATCRLKSSCMISPQTGCTFLSLKNVLISSVCGDPERSTVLTSGCSDFISQPGSVKRADGSPCV